MCLSGNYFDVSARKKIKFKNYESVNVKISAK